MSTPFKSLVFPYDLTPVPPGTLETVKNILRSGTVRLHVFHVMGIYEETPMGYPLPPEYSAEMEKIAGQEVKNLADMFRVDGTEISAGVYRGIVDKTIIDVALFQKADAILLLSHGKGILGRILLGSASNSVLHHSPLPVILLKTDDTRKDLLAGFSKDTPPLNIIDSFARNDASGQAL